MKHKAVVFVAILGLLALCANAWAQADVDKAWRGRVYVSVNGGYQAFSPGFAYEHIDAFAFDSLISEQLSGAVDVSGADGPAFA